MNEFLYMGGYAVYVWPAYALTAAVLLINVLIPALKKKRLLRDPRRL